MPAVILRIGSLVRPRSFRMMLLHFARTAMLIVLGHPFLGARFVMNAARTAAEGNVAVSGHKTTLDNCMIFIHMPAPSSAHAHMHHGRVVGEDAAPPEAAGKADAAVPKAVIHAAVVADVRAPVAIIEPVMATEPAPVAGSPQRSNIRSRYPRAWNPEVAVRAIGPVTGRPHQPRLGADGLLINRQRWRRKPHADKNTSVRGSGNDRKQKRQQQPTHGAGKSHRNDPPDFLESVNLNRKFALSLRHCEPPLPVEVAGKTTASSFEINGSRDSSSLLSPAGAAKRRKAHG